MADQDEVDLLDKAVTWAVTNNFTEGGVKCPFCSKDFRLNEDTNPSPQKVRDHIQEEHPVRVVFAMQANDINVDMRDDEEESVGLIEGLSMVDEYDKTDYLYIDPQLREECRRTGDALRWVAPRNVTRNKAMGADMVTVKSGDDAISMQTGGDGVAQANEMKLMRFPAALVHKRQEIRDRRAENSLSSRKEEAEIQADEHQKQLYDRLIKEGTDPSKARQVAQAIAGRDDQGDWRGRDSQAHTGINIS